MSTTPTLRDAAQALLSTFDTSPTAADDGALVRAVDAIRAALTQGAGEAVEPVGWLDIMLLIQEHVTGHADIYGTGRIEGEMTAAEAIAGLCAQQLQQAVARAVEECAVICEDLADRACAAQEGPTDDTTNVMLRQVATLGARECAALIRSKGTHD